MDEELFEYWCEIKRTFASLEKLIEQNGSSGEVQSHLNHLSSDCRSFSDDYKFVELRTKNNARRIPRASASELTKLEEINREMCYFQVKSRPYLADLRKGLKKEVEESGAFLYGFEIRVELTFNISESDKYYDENTDNYIARIPHHYLYPIWDFDSVPDVLISKDYPLSNLLGYPPCYLFMKLVEHLNLSLEDILRVECLEADFIVMHQACKTLKMDRC